MKKYRFTKRFERSFAKLPKSMAALFEKKILLFLENPYHPSFRVKRIGGLKNPEVWEASLTIQYRWTFQKGEKGIIIFRNIGTHDILEKRKI